MEIPRILFGLQLSLAKEMQRKASTLICAKEPDQTRCISHSHPTTLNYNYKQFLKIPETFWGKDPIFKEAGILKRKYPLKYEQLLNEPSHDLI